MSYKLEFSLTFKGAHADDHLLDMYDAAKAVAGFQRSLALTTHLILHGEIITQATSLKDAQILIPPFEESSWKSNVLIVFTIGAFHLSTAPTDTPLGNIIHSAYSYVIKESLGFDVNYEDTIQEQFRQHKTLTNKKVDRSRLDALVEKCENSITDIHRPVVKSHTANIALIECKSGLTRPPLFPELNRSTYEYISHTQKSKVPRTLLARITSYNLNTYKGRAYLPDLGSRTIPFTLTEDAKHRVTIGRLTASMNDTAQNPNDEDYGWVYVKFLSSESSTGRIKSIHILQIFTVSEYERKLNELN